MNKRKSYYIIILLILIIFISYFFLSRPLKDKIKLTQDTIDNKLMLIKEYKNNYQKLTELRKEISQYEINQEEITDQINKMIISNDIKIINLKSQIKQDELVLTLKLEGEFKNISDLAIELADMQGSPELISMKLGKAEKGYARIVFQAKLSFKQGGLIR